MKLFFLISCLFLQGALWAQQDKEQRISELMRAYTKLGRFNGSVLVAEDNKIILQAGYGFQDATMSKANDEFSIFMTGSVTKQFTAAVILKLQEQKKLSVNDKLSKYFPKYPNGSKITIRQLLTHTSGIYNYTDNDSFMAKEPTRPATREKMMVLFQDKPLDFEPGTKWNYSNSGYSMLGYIIEKVTGKSYYQAVHETILQPLGMAQSGFHFLNISNANKTTGYYALSRGDQKPAPVVDSSVSFSAGALYSSVSDLYLWTKTLNLQNAILKPASWKQAFTPVKNKYGYGLAIDSIFDQQIITHSGGIFGFNSNVLVMPARGISVILLANVTNRDLQKITEDITAILLRRKFKMPEAPPPALQLPEEILNQYAGEYEFNPGFKVTIWVKDGVLMALPTGQPEFVLIAEKENFFRITGVDAQVEFIKGAGNEVEKLILYQSGRQLPGKKIK
jgi:CubicO group peptidase (beta-lactamase class C family)